MTGMYTLGNRTVNRLGYGAMQLAGPGVLGPPKDHGAALAVLREVAACGVNHIDTSDFYGPHVTNRLIREALHPYSDDLVIVTKADGALAAAASRAVADYRHALGFLRREEHRPRPEVVAISALERRGLDEVERAIKARHEAMAASGARTRRRAAQAKAALWAELAETLLERLRGDNALKPVLATLEARVAAGALTPAKAARLGAAAFLKRKGKRG